jgi:hypothetical protein
LTRAIKSCIGLAACCLAATASQAQAARAPIFIGGDVTHVVDVFDASGAKKGAFNGDFTTNDGFAAGDSNGDGVDDVLIGGDETHIVDQFFPFGGKSSPSFNGDFTFGDGFDSGDVNGDGFYEILIAGDQTGVIDIFDRNGNRPLPAFDGDFTPGDGFAAGDVDGDGNAEILVGGDGSGVIDVFDGSGAKLSSFDGDFTAGDGFAAGDVDGDGDDEILVGGDQTGTIDIFTSTGSRPFPPFNGNFTPGDGFDSGDVDSDGDDEIVVAGDQSGIVDIFDGNGNRPVPAFDGDFTTGDGFAVGNDFPDRDGDSLLDVWETAGIDANGDGTLDLDLQALGASPDHKDVFIEIDSLGVDHVPIPAAVTTVQMAFANASTVTNPDGITGINLVVVQDETLPHVNDLTMWGDFDSTKALSFGTPAERANANTIAAKRMAFHYSLWGHTYNAGGSSGLAEFGNDFTVTLGANGWGVNGSGHTAGTQAEQAGTLMHEFGHNLGLGHGGSDAVNCKPNYVSIMSYTFQTNGILNSVSGLNRFDYSAQALPTLNESSLNEPAGIGDGTDQTLWDSDNAGAWQGSVGNAAIDWDADGTLEPSVAVDVNQLGIADCQTASPGQVLPGFDDWRNIDFNFRDGPDFADGSHVTVPVNELNVSDAQVIGAQWERYLSLGHFKEYETAAATPVFETRTASVRDSFGPSNVVVTAPIELLNPVDKNAEGMSRVDAHLTCYRIRDRSKKSRERRRKVRIGNQFGVQTLALREATRLCLPATKNGALPAPPGGIDHFKCYVTKPEKLKLNVDVTLRDDYAFDEVNVGPPQLFCNPASKNRSEILRPGDYLVCYQLRRLATFTRTDVSLLDQFGSRSSTVVRPRRLCVPSGRRNLGKGPTVGTFALSPSPISVGARSSFRLSLSERAAVTITIGRQPLNRRVGVLRRSRLGAGRRTIAFDGRVTRRPLEPGVYRATIVATDAAGDTSRPRQVTFRVVPR